MNYEQIKESLDKYFKHINYNSCIDEEIICGEIPTYYYSDQQIKEAFNRLQESGLDIILGKEKIRHGGEQKKNSYIWSYTYIEFFVAKVNHR